MKLRYLPDTSEGPVLLFQNAEPRSARALVAAVNELATGRSTFVELHAVPGIYSIDGCRLVALASDTARLDVPPGATDFIWSLRRVQWQTVAGLLEPFAAAEPGAGYHQYLGEAGAATVIISTSDHWQGERPN